jgi:hypothetical protein
MAWKIVLMAGGLIGVVLIGAAVLTAPPGDVESGQSGHWYLLAGGLGVLVVTAPLAWLVRTLRTADHPMTCRAPRNHGSD